MGDSTNAIFRAEVKTFSDSVQRSTGTTAYADGDVIANVTSNDYFTFGTAGSGTALGNQTVRRGLLGGRGLIIGARLHSSQDNQTLKLDATLWLFNSAITEDVDNAAFTPTDSEALNYQGRIDFAVADWLAGTRTSGAGGNAVCEGSRGGSLEFELPFQASESGLLYGILQARNAYAPVDSELFTIYLDIVKL